ncbi:MAG: RNA polymerase sigma factor [Deltaproteobacteria bacterium]|nr:RNA polymerase sigma factor [Deltaproteobacteria bacterium]
MTSGRGTTKEILDSLSDEELMRRLGSGEEESLRVLYVRHGGFVSQVLHRIAPELGEGEREELRQDVFLVLSDTAPRYEERQRFKAWLYGIAARKARHLRQATGLRRRLLRERRSETVGMAPTEGISPERTVADREEVSRALSVLSESQREVLLLHVEGFSGDEIAGMLDIRPKTVWTRLHRARQALTQKLSRVIKQNDRQKL